MLGYNFHIIFYFDLLLYITYSLTCLMKNVQLLSAITLLLLLESHQNSF